MTKIRKTKPWRAALALLAGILLAGCALANHPSGAPLGLDGAGAMPADPCRAMDYARSFKKPASASWVLTTDGPCRSTIRQGGTTATELAVTTDAGDFADKTMTAHLYVSTPEPVRAYWGPSAWVGTGRVLDLESVDIPAGDKQRVILTRAWGHVPGESKQASIIIHRTVGHSLAKLELLGAWWMDRAPPASAAPITKRVPPGGSATP